MDYNEEVILATLAYAHIFQYPLTKEELWCYAIARKQLNKRSFFKTLDTTTKVMQKDEQYALKDASQFIEMRLERAVYAKEKLVIAKKVASVLSKIPTILCIGISGSLSMLNTDKADDIDLFIITQQHTVWITRLFVLLVLQLLGKRRKRVSSNVQNSVCVNLLVEESSLTIPFSSQNLYTAHEVMQVKPLYNRRNTYEKFLAENIWVRDYLPNRIKVPEYHSSEVTKKKNSVTLILYYFLTVLNFLAKKIQLWYMREHRTSEIITNATIAFYPSGRGEQIIKAYRKKLKEYKIYERMF